MYIERSLQPMLDQALAIFPVVLLTGARQVGKSTLVMRTSGDYLTLDDINLYTAAGCYSMAASMFSLLEKK